MRLYLIKKAGLLEPAQQLKYFKSPKYSNANISKIFHITIKNWVLCINRLAELVSASHLIARDPETSSGWQAQ